ncbi:hypothetical protein LOK49_LG14G00514 [Camellia lanceoleosa]|uniref:Uncharacterized protein n=1 Tax=Camellia lanceoleosa TaxID=1840588 RepID=A0ACC0FDE1_9ERIC|nr:hypothetical protein LOK49_LG14G00514 [Camellia lanceoleosa]
MAHDCCSPSSINEKTHSKLGILHGVGLALKTHIHVVMLPACICCCLSLKSFGHQSLNLLVSTMERNPCDGKEASPAETSWFPEIQNHWMEAQDSLKRRLVTEDDVIGKLPTNTNTATTSAFEVGGEKACKEDQDKSNSRK